MSQEEQLYLKIGQSISNAIKSQLFGKPCFKVNGKAFISFFEDSMVFKLNGESHSEALSLDGSRLFDPSKKNRPMKEWVEVPKDYQERWLEFAEAAFEYVNSLSK